MFRCAAGALNRDTGQAGNGNRCAEPQAPLCPRLLAIVATSPLANSKWCNADLRSATENLGDIDDTSISGGRYQHLPGFCSPLIYTDAYTFGFENWLISVAFPNVREQAGFGTLISAVNKRSLVRLKMRYLRMCPFESGQGHHRRRAFRLVDAPDSKSRSARSAGSIPAARTTQVSKLCKVLRTGDRSLHQRIARVIFPWLCGHR